MRAEREKRAVVLASEASATPRSTRPKVTSSASSRHRGQQQQQINEAEGQAAAILAVATARPPGCAAWARPERARWRRAMQLRIGEEYVRQFGKLAKDSPRWWCRYLSDLASVVSMATSIVRKTPPL